VHLEDKEQGDGAYKQYCRDAVAYNLGPPWLIVKVYLDLLLRLGRGAWNY